MSEGLQIWLDPEKYGSLRPLWQDSYIWSPVAVDESFATSDRYTGVKSSTADRKPSPEEDLSSTRRRPMSYPPPEPKPGLNKRMKSFHLMKDRDDQEKSLSRMSSRRTPRTIPEPEAADNYDDDDDNDEEEVPAARIPRRRRTRKALSNIQEGQPMTSEKEDYFEQAPPPKPKRQTTADQQQPPPLRQPKSDPALADEEPAPSRGGASKPHPPHYHP
ncbi:hypothetical protein PG997_007046 [Apiospora hydei]|uniref:Uncharacterized protein n=1 Tax=Apiospora hydei TaxID=1337664 RepID=A0ABR1WS14_9PEZI